MAANTIKPQEPLIEQVLQSLENGQPVLPGDVACLERMMNNLDEIYWDLSDAGNQSAALNAFSKARLYSAVCFASNMTNADRASEAIYEAAASTESDDDVLNAAARCL